MSCSASFESSAVGEAIRAVHSPVGYEGKEIPKSTDIVACKCGMWRGTYSSFMRSHIRYQFKKSKCLPYSFIFCRLPALLTISALFAASVQRKKKLVDIETNRISNLKEKENYQHQQQQQVSDCTFRYSDCVSFPCSIFPNKIPVPSRKRKKGRPFVHLEDHSNQTMKHKWLFKKVMQWVGQENEARSILTSFHNSSFWKHYSASDTDTEHDRILKQLGQHLCERINEQLPTCSPFRKELINMVCEDMPARDLQHVLKLSAATIFRSKNLQSNQLITQQCKITTREKVPPNDIASIKEYMLECCPVRSGENRTIRLSCDDIQPKHTQMMSDTDLYRAYVAHFTSMVRDISHSTLLSFVMMKG